ncbi:RCC1 domain-containing protein [Kutzneria sp. NPDC052558]|uniref:RCC1 domain-containing protein n=1 Tax=Kutzneria sp. NPDC052558 TaxID=3364121 RepID=UPI0037C96C6C
MFRRAIVLAAVLVVGTAVPAAATPGVAPAGSGFTPLSPTRVLDTRDGTGVQKNSANNLMVDLSSVVPAQATAVVVNLTAVEHGRTTGVLVWPDGQQFPDGHALPDTAALVVDAGRTAANLATVPVPASRKLDLYASADTDLIMDLAGYYAAGAGEYFTAMGPQRMLDTRTTGGPVGPNGTTVLDLSPAVPAGATTAVFNLTATDTTGDTYVTAWPDGLPRPSASAMNLTPGQTRANLVTIALPPSRKVDLYNHVGAVDLIADLVGYYTPGRGQAFFPYAGRGLVGADVENNGTLTVEAAKQVPPTATAAVVNVTASGATSDTYVTVWPAGTQRPSASTLNLGPSEDVPNMAIAGLDSTGKFSVYNHVGHVTLEIDLDGYFASASPACSAHCPVSWGGNDRGKLGTGTSGAGESRPGQVFGLSDVTAITGGTDNGAALDSDGAVWAWGRTFAQAASPLIIRDQSPVPMRLWQLPPASAIAYGDATGYALGRDGSVWGWGDNSHHQVSAAADEWLATPRQIAGPGMATAIAASNQAGYLVGGGKVYGWGPLADLGGPTPGAFPQEVVGLSDVTAISGTGDNGQGGAMFARRSDGTVWAWGSQDVWDQRGAPNLPANTPPNQVPGLPAIVGLAVGNSADTGYALAADGTVWAWGGNMAGALGTGEPTILNPTPHQVVGLTGATAIAAGYHHGLALKSDGTVWSWGDNSQGQRGTGLSGVTAIGAGSLSSYAVIG